VVIFRSQKGYASKNVWETLIYRGSNTREHDFSIFYAVLVTTAKCSLHAAGMKYCKQTEERISICTTVRVCVCVYSGADKSLARSSAKIRWKSSCLDFFGIKTASSSLIIFQRAKLSTRSITHLCWFGPCSLFPSWSG
jgi:hypothetical protein